jgi:hypothetical protein
VACRLTPGTKLITLGWQAFHGLSKGFWSFGFAQRQGNRFLPQRGAGHLGVVRTDTGHAAAARRSLPSMSSAPPSRREITRFLVSCELSSQL